MRTVLCHSFVLFKENPLHLRKFSVWQMRGSSYLAQKHSSDMKPMSEHSEAQVCFVT